jgi:amino acid transporter
MKDRNTIGLWAAVSIGVGGMIGAGIFSILGVAGQVAGNAMYVAFIAAGLVALLSTYSYAKLGARYPSAGGPVEFLIMGFGDGVLSGGLNILLWVGYVFALSLYAKAFGGYASALLTSQVSGIWTSLLGTSVILIFTAINFIGAKAVGRSELLIVSVKLIILLLFAGVGLFFAKPTLLSFSHWPAQGHIFYAAAIVFLAYEGFGLITNAAEDMKDPRKTLPRALYLSVLITIAVYVLVSLAVVGNLPIPDILKARDYALAEAARPFLGSAGFTFIAIAALFSTSSAINATLYGGANVSYVIAKEGELPVVFERKVWRTGTEGLLITTGLVILLINLLDLDGIAMLGSGSFLILYAAVGAAHLKLLGETGAKPIPIWLSVIGCIVSLLVLSYYELVHSPLTLVVLASILVLVFGAEWTYRKVSSRTLKRRSDRVPS